MKTNKTRKKKNRMIFLFSMALLLLSAGIIALCVKESLKEKPQKAEKREEKEGVEINIVSEKEDTVTQTDKILSGMSLEEKVAQLFVLTPETLTGEEAAVQVTEQLRSGYETYPVGGFIAMQGNITSPEQIIQFNSDLDQLGRQMTGMPPFLAVDEEGGTVVRIAGNEAFPVENVGNMSEVGASSDRNAAYETGAYIGGYLVQYGFNVDFAPDADVWVNPYNEVVRYRAFSSDPYMAADMVSGAVEGFHSAGICTALKHFPGHGATAEDSHAGFAYSPRTLEKLRECEFLPFQAGIDAGSEFVMVGHITLPEVTGTDTPSTLSRAVVTEILRDEMGYDGILITDAMNMGAIAQNYSSADAAVLAVEAGMDMILMPVDFQEAYQGILAAVQDGRITEERLDESVRRIIELKQKL